MITTLDHPIITIFMPISRRWAVDALLANLQLIGHDPAKTNLAFIIDGDMPAVERKVQKYAAEHGYRKIVTRLNRDWQTNEVRLSVRRMRVADVKNQSRDLINQCDGDYVVCIEDDTVFNDPDMLFKLLSPMIESRLTGFVEGVQCGRWGAKMIGAWQADNPRNPLSLESLRPKDPPVTYEVITAGGFYGYATRRDLYVNHEYYTSSAQPWGPDVNYGLWLAQRGYVSLINWTLEFGHNDHGKVLWPRDAVDTVLFTKDPNTGRWDRMDTEERPR